jgi:hypothetical protein
MMIRRRELIALVGGAVAWPLAARAQQPATPVIGFLSSRSSGESTGVVAAFREGLRETGFVEGRNLAIAFRWAEGHYDRLPELAAELVSLPVALLFAAGGTPTAFAAKSATSTIPIVFSADAGCWPVYRVARAARRAARSWTAVIGVNVSGHDACRWPLLQLSPGDDLLRGLAQPGFVTIHEPMLSRRLRARRRGARGQVLNALCETGDLCS